MIQQAGGKLLTVLLVAAIEIALRTLLRATYEVCFLGRFGATPGKMVCRLRVVGPDHTRLTYTRALARHFAGMLSLLTLLIGYLIAAFDSEKRALHDHICNTRVVCR